MKPLLFTGIAIRSLIAALLLGGGAATAADAPQLNLLYLGDGGHHKPFDRFRQLDSVLKAKGITLTYTDKVDDLNAANLAKYDGLIVFANQTKIAPEQEKALLDFVASGKVFIPLHCASYCFLNSEAYIGLVGAQFRSHWTGTFRVENVKADHPIMKGYSGSASWDETYLHHKHNEKDRVVLEVRAEGDLKEPWMWVRTHGKGRVFYTAWGHDQRTWSNPGFHNLVERGIRWACGQDPSLAGTFADRPEMTPERTDATPEKLVETLKHLNMGCRQHAQRLLVERGFDGSALIAAVPGAQHSLAKFKDELLGIADEATTSELAPAAVLKAFVDDRSWTTRPELAEPLVRDAWKMAAGVKASRTREVLIAKDRSTTGTASPEVREVMEWLAREAAIQGNEEDISRIFKACAARSEQGSPSVVTESILAGLSSGWPSGKEAKASAELEQALQSLLPKVTPATRTKLIKFASLWKIKGIDAQLAELTKSLFATAADAKAADDTRLEAARQVLDFLPEDDAAIAKLLGAVSLKSSPAFANGLFDALSASRAKGFGSSVLAKLKEIPPTARPAAMRLVLGRGESAKAFLDAVEAGQVRFDMLSLDQKNALASHPTKAIAERARKLLELGGGLPNADRQKVIEELTHVLKNTGSVDAGKKVFIQHCSKCHKHGNDGAQVGPDLTGFGTHPKEEILIHLLDPSRSVVGNFKAYRAVTADGRVIVGLLASESKTAIEMVDAEGKRHPLSRDNLESLTESDKSLMPEGFEKQAKPEELADLLEFLTQKGKWVPLPLDRAATIVSTEGMFISEEGKEQRLIFPDWKPKTFEGVPFVLVDPQGDRVKNVILLHGPNGKVSSAMPKSVTVPCNTAAKSIHLLSGVGGWNALAPRNGNVCLIVRLHYADGKTEDHPLKDGVHFADYIRRADVPGSKFAFALRSQQVRYLAIEPKRREVIKTIEFVKGDDRSAPVVMAVTVVTHRSLRKSRSVCI